MVLARVAGEPQEAQLGEGEDAMVEIVHDEVFSTGTDDEAVKFRVEFLVPVVHRDACLMQRGQDYVIVGRPECAGDSWTLIAEKSTRAKVWQTPLCYSKRKSKECATYSN